MSFSTVREGIQALLAQQLLVYLDFESGVTWAEFLAKRGGKSVGLAQIRVILADFEPRGAFVDVLDKRLRDFYFSRTARVIENPDIGIALDSI